MILFAFKHMQFGGGAEKNLIDVALHVAQRERVGFYIAGGYVDPRMAAAGPVFTMPGRGRFWLAPLDLLHLVWTVVRHRVTLMHAHHRYPAFMASIVRRVVALRLITTVHNRFPNRARASLWGDRAIAVSEDIAQWLRDECGTPAEKIRVIHNGIPTPDQYPAVQREALRSECAVPRDTCLLCAVGRLSEQKNFTLLLAALARLQTRSWCLLLVGEGEQRQMLERHAAELGIGDRIRFLGRRSDVPLIMQASDLLVMSSAWEGFPYVIVEALASGLPIVATDVGGVREGVLDGVTGILTPSGDTQALARGIQALIDNRAMRATMSENGRRIFGDKFRDDAMLRRIDEEFEVALVASHREAPAR